MEFRLRLFKEFLFRILPRLHNGISPKISAGFPPKNIFRIHLGTSFRNFFIHFPGNSSTDTFRIFVQEFLSELLSGYPESSNIEMMRQEMEKEEEKILK